MRTRRTDPATLIARAQATGLSRSEIARRAGLSPSAITRLANGDRGRCPSAATMDALRALDTQAETVTNGQWPGWPDHHAQRHAR